MIVILGWCCWASMYKRNYDSFWLYWLKVSIFKRNHWGIEVATESQTIFKWSMVISKLVKIISGVLNQDRRFSAERTVYFLILMAYIEFSGTVYFQREDRIVSSRAAYFRPKTVYIPIFKNRMFYPKMMKLSIFESADT